MVFRRLLLSFFIFFMDKIKLFNMTRSDKTTINNNHIELHATNSGTMSPLTIFLVLASASASFCVEDVSLPRKFPDGFLFGAASASYQVEGAWDEDGKALSWFDVLYHNGECHAEDCSTGDVATDGYHKYKRDVEIMRELGLDHYRFSISWARLLPTSFPDQINEAGVKYYNNLIDEMLKYNIQPLVTLYHWDLPQKLGELGGWANPHIVDWFGDYARVTFRLFGDRVKLWTTFNEPKEICYSGYVIGRLVPKLKIPDVAGYLCMKNLLLAHARAYHIYDEEFRNQQGGSINIVLNTENILPYSENDIQAAEDHFQFHFGIFANPIFTPEGNFPKVVIDRVKAKSLEQGFFRSRLPELSAEEVDYIRGTSDNFGFNNYFTVLVYRNETDTGIYDVPSFQDDIGTVEYIPDDWDSDESIWPVTPWGMRDLLLQIKERYNNPPVFITENGIQLSRDLEDDERISFLKSYLSAVLDAVDEGCNVIAYTHWSMIDNFGWKFGLGERFGLYDTDYESPDITRTPKKSAFFYKELLRTRTLDMNYEANRTVMTIDPGH